MDKPKNVMVPETFMVDVYRLVGLLDGRWPDDGIKTLCHSLEAVIRAKNGARERRESFSAYKTAAMGSEERELLRQSYLNTVGIPQDWRTGKEITP